ncbi:hypothetical protein [Streptomyces sp. enrichment culture]|uniref:hypothetical protein n=1 Tax=Streptomyces sp. enrichment culture TaxID=1795815 RepID=UPI003F54D05A
MHRTTTTATLLVTVAVSALSGCMTVQRPPASGPPAPSQPPVPRPDGHAEPQIVQAPAREALELAGVRRTSAPPPSPSAPHTPAAEPPAARQAPAQPPAEHRPRRPDHPRPHPRPARPEHPRPRVPPVDLPDVAESVRENTDVCGLGKKYGGWRADSPEARTCEQVYGR